MSTTMKSMSTSKTSNKSSHRHHNSHKSNPFNKFCKQAKNMATDVNTYIGAAVGGVVAAPLTWAVQKNRYLALNREVNELVREGKI